MKKTMKILTTPGCARARSVKQILKESRIPFKEEGLYRILCDAPGHERLLKKLAGDMACSVRDLIENPSAAARPLLVFDSETQEAKKLAALLKERGFFGPCRYSCTRRAVCPAASKPVGCLFETVSSD